MLRLERPADDEVGRVLMPAMIGCTAEQIWAMQVLETLAKEGLPSRAEVTDAAMAHRGECVMLNKGPYVVQAVKVLDDILRRMHGHQLKKRAMLRAGPRVGLTKGARHAHFWTSSDRGWGHQGTLFSGVHAGDGPDADRDGSGQGALGETIEDATRRYLRSVCRSNGAPDYRHAGDRLPWRTANRPDYPRDTAR